MNRPSFSRFKDRLTQTTSFEQAREILVALALNHKHPKGSTQEYRDAQIAVVSILNEILIELEKN